MSEHQTTGALFEATDEQRHIVLAPLRGRLKVKAFAGTGKTSTLVQKAQRHAAIDRLRGLYLAFNKSAQIEAQARFGQTAICKTTHSIAFSIVGKKFAHKLRQMRPREVVDLGLTPDYGEAKLILDAVSDYCIGADFEFPKRISLGLMASRISAPRAQQLRDAAAELWARMTDPSSSIPISHDGYLKLYQLQKPILPCDYIMVDEFQDTNPVVLDIIDRQTKPLILVGDPYQSIYAFRGAVNAMQKFRAQRELNLTQSFRFGPEVGKIACELLYGYFGETSQIVGAGAATRVGTTLAADAKQPSILTRTNAELFVHAKDAVEKGLSPGFIGGVEGYQFNRLCDARHVATGCSELAKDPFLRSFKSIWQMQDYADEVEDLELQRLIKISEEHGDGIFDLVQTIHSNAVSVDRADTVLATAHKSKGSTLDHVQLGSDFKSLVTEENGVYGFESDLDPQEVNLSYVAVTRAKLSLALSHSLSEYRAAFRSGLRRQASIEID